MGRRTSYGMPDTRGEKRTKPITVHVGPTLAKALEIVSSHERRTVSDCMTQIAERDPLVKTILQQLGGEGGN